MRFLSFLLLLCSAYSFAQNLVPNPGFEKAKKVPYNWMHNQRLFHEHMEDWTSPNGGSPDVFFIGTMGKFGFKRPNVDVSTHAPRSGKFMAGIKTYGCLSQTTHCKEYLQTKLSEPLRLGEEYYLEFWVNPIASSVRVNNFGVHFSPYELAGDDGDGEEALWLRTDILDTTIIDGRPNEWTKISGTFIAGCTCEYMLIGNFSMDGRTNARPVEGGIDYSFYLIDDIVLRPANAKSIVTTFTEAPLEVGATFTLDRIYFELDEAILLPESFEQLNELIDILRNDPNLRIRIQGHTDSQGSRAYNMDLSERRAQAVYIYLIENNIASNRIEYLGFGESQPVADNINAIGRQTNRRVEFVVLEN